MNDNYCVYKHTTPSGKVYIGLTMMDVKKRWDNGNGYKGNRHFTNAINKYGWGNITHEILNKNLSKKDASRLEQYYIYVYRSADPKYGYNKTTGGETGFEFTDEIKEKISIASKKTWEDPVYRETMKKKIAQTWKDENLRKKVSETTKQLHQDPEYRRKYIAGRESFKKKVQGVNNWKHVSILQYSLCGEFVAKFETVSEAGAAIGKPTQDISKCLVGKYRHAYGYIWVYANSKNIQDIIQKKTRPPKSCKRIKQYSLNGEYINTFDSISSAKKSLGRSRIRISECAQGLRRSAGGYIWRYE